MPLPKGVTTKATSVTFRTESASVTAVISALPLVVETGDKSLTTATPTASASTGEAACAASVKGCKEEHKGSIFESVV